MTTNDRQFGHGIVCPFRRDGKGDYAHAGGERLLRSDIGELLGLQGPTADAPGELPWRTEIGTRLDSLRHRHLHSEFVRASAEQMTGGAVRRWEPRVRAGTTQAEVSGEDTMIVRFSYTPTGYGQRSRIVIERTVEG